MMKLWQYAHMRMFRSEHDLHVPILARTQGILSQKRTSRGIDHKTNITPYCNATTFYRIRHDSPAEWHAGGRETGGYPKHKQLAFQTGRRRNQLRLDNLFECILELSILELEARILRALW